MIRKPDRKIILEDGQEYYGFSFGAGRVAGGSDSGAFGAGRGRVLELVFNTSMVGYQEILSDPSYTDQAVVMTYPLIGNYGMADDDYETSRPTIGALIVREHNEEPSNFRSTRTLGEVMEQYGILGVSGVDTRKLNRTIRDFGSRKALITDVATPLEEGLRILAETSLPHDAVLRVSCREIREEGPKAEETDGIQAAELGEGEIRANDGKCEKLTSGAALAMDGVELQTSVHPIPHPLHVVAIDCGMKENIVRSLCRRGCHVTIVPWNTPAEKIRGLKPDGVFLSNGPGDPQDVPETIQTVRELIGQVPIFGICLGHQILSLAYGARTYKLKFGHRGGNHPVKNLETGRIEITSQNHSYAVDANSLFATPLTVTHVNLLDGTVEGVRCEADRAFSVQYHPESAPGPQDSTYLFDRFIHAMEEGRKETR